MRGVREEGWKIHGLTAPRRKALDGERSAVIQRMARKRSVVKGGDFVQIAFRGGQKPRGLTAAFMAGGSAAASVRISPLFRRMRQEIAAMPGACTLETTSSVERKRRADSFYRLSKTFREGRARSAPMVATAGRQKICRYWGCGPENGASHGEKAGSFARNRSRFAGQRFSKTQFCCFFDSRMHHLRLCGFTTPTRREERRIAGVLFTSGANPPGHIPAVFPQSEGRANLARGRWRAHVL